MNWLTSIFFILLLIISEASARQQTFELVYDSSDILVGQDSTGSFNGSIINISNDTIPIVVFRRESNLPNGWSSSICLEAICYHESVDSALVELGTGDTISLGVLLWTHGLGEGTIQLEVYDLGYPDGVELLELNIESAQMANINNGGYNPQKFIIKPPYPNPFNPIVIIEYQLKESTNISLSIYDLLGRKIKTLESNYQLEGLKKIRWDATNSSGETVSSGVYICKIQVNDIIEKRKVIYIK